MELTEKQRDIIWKAYRKYDLLTHDPWRHDFCEADCTCDENSLEDCVTDVTSECPEFNGCGYELESFIRYGWGENDLVKWLENNSKNKGE